MWSADAASQRPWWTTSEQDKQRCLPAPRTDGNRRLRRPSDGAKPTIAQSRFNVSVFGWRSRSERLPFWMDRFRRMKCSCEMQFRGKLDEDE